MHNKIETKPLIRQVLINEVDELGQAAQDIGKVTEAITEISDQTKSSGPECHY